MSRKMKNSQLIGLGFGLTVLGLVPLPQIGAANVMIVSPNPKAVVLREGSSNPKPAIYLMWLNNGDLVKPDSETALEVVCDDGKVRTVESGEFVGLPTICPRAVRNTGSTFDSRGEDDFLKYLDLRFYTVTLLDGSQVIRWQEVNGATGYRVQLGTRQEILLDRQVDCPKVSYGGNQPLKLGVDYNFLVKALGGNNSEFRLRFKVLTEKESQELNKRIAVIQSNKGLPEIAKAIALADIYNEYELAEQAIAVLGKASLVVNQAGQSVAIAERMLGNFYLQVGLRDVAELHYRRALELAQSEQNLEVLAEAQIGLAKVFVVNGKKQEARKYLQLALANYASLENSAKKRQVDEWLRKISK
ncbi:tetratricopeptide repeat protein [Pseudanabaena sp. ABRG5-3]|uniref:tetratricopeptide repeat protein n=1 Tax=Pseudanabaena sp. ABRG5-3 TaxID=685565 RepID=UPI000DC6EE01|nr:tetratricopeptide repeat protein [Pseudanabaena sp. ABRG5-3]BBC26668.1 tetratricopeptide repeat domain protein [Pseudanabaena sp. ABRG5-3]